MNGNFCEIPAFTASDEELREILTQAKTVAVVGLSDNPERESHQVAAYLQTQGYRIIPVNPNVGEVLGEKAYPSVAHIPADIAVDVVEIFRRPEFVPEIVDQAIARKAQAVWMQKGIVHNSSGEKARQAGLAVVMDRCMMVEHRRLGIGQRGSRS